MPKKTKSEEDIRVNNFAFYYVNGGVGISGNAYQSMILAGYPKSSAKASTKFTRKENVQVAIKKEEEELRRRLDAAYNEVMNINIATLHRDIGDYYRTETYKDNDGVEHEIQALIPLDELTPEQRKQIVDVDYKGARGVPGYKFLDTQTAMNNIAKEHEKIHGETDNSDEDKSLEVTLEGIKDKVTAKIKLIAKKDQESEIAEDYRELPAEATEEL